MDYNFTKDGQDFHIVRGCMPPWISVDQCGATEKNLLITVAQPSYDQSDFVEAYKA
jgi:hypothetical protein